MRSWAALMLIAAGCTQPADLPRIVPERLTVKALPGGNGVLELLALTLRQGAGGPEVYASVQNRDTTPACDAALSIELFDQEQQSVAAGISGLLAPHFYRRTTGTDAIVGCIGPGDVSMAAITDLPAELAADDVGFIVYRCPYSALEVEAIAGLTVRDVRSVSSEAGTAYTGRLINMFDQTVMRPSVSVFPIDRVGRPLGMVSTPASATTVAPGESWTFETAAADGGGSDRAAFAEGALASF